MSLSFLMAVFVPPITISTVPGLLVWWIFGGKGLAYFSIAAFWAIAVFLFWGFVLGGIETLAGFEVIWLMLYPTWWLVGSLWCWALARVLSSLSKNCEISLSKSYA